MPRLVNISDPEGKAYEVEEDRFSIGRRPENDLVLMLPLVSRKHARIEKNGESYRIVDLGSRNGVYVNKLKVENERLAHGDVITIGPVELMFDHPPQPANGESLNKDAALTLRGKEVVLPVPEPGADYEVDVLLSLKDDRKWMSRMERNSTGIKAEKSPGRVGISLPIYHIARQINTAASLQEFLQKTIDLIRRMAGADRAVFYMADSGVPGFEASSEKEGLEPPHLGLVRSVAAKALDQNVAILCKEASLVPPPGEKLPKEALQVMSAMSVPIWKQDRHIGAIYLDSVTDPRAFDEDDMEHISAIANLVALRIEQDRMHSQVKKSAVFRANLERFHSPDVVNLIIKQSEDPEGFSKFLQEREVTVLFADIVEFTSLIEKLDPQAAAELLSEFFDEMTAVIFKYGGTVDKFTGDGIMAIFGAPISHGNDAELAIFSAIEMMQAMEWFKARRRDKEKFDIRIGINTGMVLSGYMGSKKRIEYSVLGDPVNVAARLQDMAEPKTILIGDDTYAKISGMFELKDEGTTRLKGKKKQTRIYRVMY